MQSVYTFSRSEEETSNQLLQVCSSGRGLSREQWIMQAELLVEPLAWDALWKLSKSYCKKFEVRFPCIAYVTVRSVDYEDLSASVDVLSVQHESVSLPEQVDNVPLIEFWPTIKQREKCVNAQTTAEFIDILRFYYNNIWMPWDDQDDKILLSNTVEDRMKLWSELHNGTIPNCIGRTITLLRTSAIDAHEKLKALDSSLGDGMADNEDDDSLLTPNFILKCAELNARLDSIMSKWTLYQNTLIREQYIAKEKNKWIKNRKNRNIVALWRGGSVSELDEISKFLNSRQSTAKKLTIVVSPEEAFSMEPEEVVICSKEYEVPEMPLSNIFVYSFNGATLKASDMRSCLFMLNDECRLCDLTLQCGSANTIIVMRQGVLRVTNCTLMDDSTSSQVFDYIQQCDFAQGVVAMAGAKVILEDCILDNFYSGIVVHKGAQVELRNCIIQKCGVGIQLYSGSQVKLDSTNITDCAEQCIRCELDSTSEDVQMDVKELQILPNCIIGSSNAKNNILVVRQEATLL